MTEKKPVLVYIQDWRILHGAKLSGGYKNVSDLISDMIADENTLEVVKQCRTVL